jgi:hypothetical protein
VAGLLRSDRARVVLLNATLLLVFATAWVSHSWPEFTVPAIVLAFAIVIGEAALLYVAAKKEAAASEAAASRASAEAVRRLEAREGSGSSEVVLAQNRSMVEYADLISAYQRYFSEHHKDASRELLRDRELLAAHHHYMVYALRPRASRVSSWALATLHENRSLYLAFARELELRLASEVELRRALRANFMAPSELAKWKVTTQGEEAFNISAGAFEIEYFRGRTNIRVLDSSRVTVEDERRGVKSKVAPPGMDAPIYQ